MLLHARLLTHAILCPARLLLWIKFSAYQWATILGKQTLLLWHIVYPITACLHLQETKSRTDCCTSIFFVSGQNYGEVRHDGGHSARQISNYFVKFWPHWPDAHTHTLSHLHTCTFTHLHTYTLTQLHTYTLTHLHTYTLTHLHTYTLVVLQMFIEISEAELHLCSAWSMAMLARQKIRQTNQGNREKIYCMQYRKQELYFA